MPANHSYFEDDVTHLYRKVDRDTTNIPKTKNADNIAPPNIISFILISLFNYFVFDFFHFQKKYKPTPDRAYTPMNIYWIYFISKEVCDDKA